MQISLLQVEVYSQPYRLMYTTLRKIQMQISFKIVFFFFHCNLIK